MAQKLAERLSSDLKDALKAGDGFKTGVLRLLVSAIKNKEIERGSKSGESLADEDVIQILATEAKKRREASELFAQGGRADLAEQEQRELEVIQIYLPKLLSAEEAEKNIKKIIDASRDKQFGPVMKAVMAELKGKADAKAVTEIVKKLLG